MISDVLSKAVEDLKRYLSDDFYKRDQRLHRKLTALCVLMDEARRDLDAPPNVMPEANATQEIAASLMKSH